MKNTAKRKAYLLSRNILSIAAVVSLMGAAAFAAAPTGGYQPGATLNPDCAPGDTDCIVQGGDMTDDSWTMSGANVVVENGNVGIGTAGPTQGLHIHGDTGTKRLLLTRSDNAFSTIMAPGNVTFDSSRPAIGFKEDGVSTWSINSFGSKLMFASPTTTTANAKVTFDSTGNVGIGTTNPRGGLEISKAPAVGQVPIPLTTDVTSSNLAQVVISNSDNGTVGAVIGHSNPTGGTYTTYLQARTLTASNRSQPLLLNPLGGNVGIGTDNPVGKLNVVATSGNAINISGLSGVDTGHEISINRSSSASTRARGPNIRFNDSTLSNNIMIQNAEGALSFWNYGSGTVWSEKMRIAKDGSVGIGTTNPSEKFEVNGGDAKINGITVGRGPMNNTYSTVFGNGAYPLGNGSYNLAVGRYALRESTTGTLNTAVGGYYPMAKNTTGSRNVGIGTYALRTSADGNNNTAVGYDAMQGATGGNYNIGIGYRGLGTIGTGSNENVGIGTQAGRIFKSGSNNVFLGRRAADTFGTGSSNIAIGALSNLPQNEGDNQLSIGKGIFGTDINSISGVNIGIGTSTPGSTLHIAKTKSTLYDAASLDWQQSDMPTLKIQNTYNSWGPSTSQILFTSRSDANETGTRIVNKPLEGLQFVLTNGGVPSESVSFNVNGDVKINKLSGTGNAFACLDANGTLYRSATACN